MCAILYERIHWHAVGGEVGNHVRLGHDDLPVQNVVIGVVAMVDHKREVDHETCRVALAVGAGVRLVGRQAVVGKEFVVALAVDDDATARAFHLRSEVNPAANIVK